MAITVELSPEIETRLLAQAKARGVTVGAVVEEFIAMATKTASGAVQLPAERLSNEEFDRILDEAAAMVPGDVVLSDYAMSRESIYTREDEW